MTTNDALRRTLTKTICDAHNHPNPLSVWGENPSKLVTATEIALEEQFILIDRHDLPEVTVDEDGDVWSGGLNFSKHANTHNLRDKAKRILAVADHIEANPPINQVEVGNLRALLEAAPGTNTATDLATHLATWLVKQGVRVR